MKSGCRRCAGMQRVARACGVALPEGHQCSECQVFAVLDAAVAELGRLRAAVVQNDANMAAFVAKYDQAVDEIEQLRAELAAVPRYLRARNEQQPAVLADLIELGHHRDPAINPKEPP